MVEARLFIDSAVGETRRLLVDRRERAIRIDVQRASEKDCFARVGEIWAAQIIRQSPDGGWHVDLGPGGEGLLQSRRAGRRTNGERLAVKISAEARGEKGAVVEVLGAHEDAPVGTGRLSSFESDPFLDGVEILEVVDDFSARDLIDEVIDTSTAPSSQLKCGGRVWIETTRLGTTIDVDRAHSTDPVETINHEAACESALQVGLRALSGLLLVDFIGAPNRARAERLANAFKQETGAIGLKEIDCLGLSRFGLMQAVKTRRRRDLRSSLCGLPAEREALDGLRLLESLGRANRSARLCMDLSQTASAWLESNLPVWEVEMADRIGRRWKLLSADRPVGAPDVRVMR